MNVNEKEADFRRSALVSTLLLRYVRIIEYNSSVFVALFVVLIIVICLN